MPTPPDLGVVCVCALRASGRSGTPMEIMMRTMMPENMASPPMRARWRGSASGARTDKTVMRAGPWLKPAQN